MPTFHYRAKDASGKASDGTLEAADKDAVVRVLLGEGLYVYRVDEVGGMRAPGEGQTSTSTVGQGCFSALIGNIFPFVTVGELAMVTRQLATGIGSGLGITHALTAVLEGVLSPLMRDALRDAQNRVSEGHSFADTLAHHSRVFNRMYRGMVRVGEESGTLDIILSNLADLFEEEVEMRRRIQSAMIYPGCIVAFLLLATFILAWLDFLPFGIFQMIIFGVIVLVAIWLIAMNRHVSRAFRSFLSWLPGIGTLIKRISLARTCYTLGTLIRSGVPYLEAVELSKESANLHQMERALDRVCRDIGSGIPLSESISRQRIFPPMMRNLLSVGESSGSVDAALFKVYEYLRNDIRSQTRNLAAMLGPTLLLILAVIVGYVVITFWQNYWTTIMQVGDL